jgi:hypothetical protein
MLQQSQTRYPLGSSRQWRETLVLLVVPLLITSALFRIFLQYVGISFASSVASGIFFFFGALVVSLWSDSNSPRDEIVPGLTDITVNLAHGWAEDDGIHFKKWFRRRFVSWRGIARAEYWPDRQGRIDLHLYSQRSPVVFVAPRPRQEQAGVATGEPETVNYVSLKLNQACPGHSTFLISFEKDRKEAGTILSSVDRLSIRGKACVNALLMFIGGIIVYALVTIWAAYPRPLFWKGVAVIWGLLLIQWLRPRLLRKSKMGSATGKHINPAGHSPGSTKRLN